MVLSWEKALAAGCDEESLLQIARLAEVGLSAAATAHDLRQPLSAVKMSLQLIRERLAGRPEAGDVDVALKNVDRIEALVERTRNLFAASRGVERIRLGE